MHITEPSFIVNSSIERLNEGYLQNRLAILEHALLCFQKSPSIECLQEAVDFLGEEIGIDFLIREFRLLLDLYPYVRVKLADYGWGDTEVRELVLDMVAHAILGSRWPIFGDKCDSEAFAERLRHVFASKGKDIFANASLKQTITATN